jgi:hypothetical protein
MANNPMDTNGNSSDSSKIGVNQNSFINILNQVAENIKEERNLALDRYKAQDDNIDSDESFALQGKVLCDLLKIAAERSNSLMNMGRLIAGILYKDANLEQSTGISEDDIKEAVKRQIQEESSNFDVPDIDDKNK